MESSYEENNIQTMPQEWKNLYLLSSIVHNDIDSFRKLFHYMDWSHILPEYGYSLLQLAVLYANKEAFDYLLSQGFPLEARNYNGHTALEITLTSDFFTYPSTSHHEYFAIELLKKGAQLFPEALLNALKAGFTSVAQYLLDRGLDPNGDRNNNYLHHVVFSDQNKVELVNLLLAYGADPLIEDSGLTQFEHILINVPELRQTAIDYVIDDDCSLRVGMFTLTYLAFEDYPTFCKILKHVDEIVVDRSNFMTLEVMQNFDRVDFREMEDKLFFILIFVLEARVDISNYCPFIVNRTLSLDNFHLFVEETFGFSFGNFFGALITNLLFKSLFTFRLREATVTGIVCYLLSQGLTPNRFDLQLVYQKYGYGELFKIMLHMKIDIRQMPLSSIGGSAVKTFLMPMFIYIFNLDIDSYFDCPAKYILGETVYGVGELLHYFVHPRLTRICEGSPDEELRNKIKEFPKVPLLKQLARDTFRKFLIEECRIKTTRVFFTAVNYLEIGDVYKKIITYETRLY